MSETVIRPSDHPAAQDDPDQHRDHGHDEKEVNEPARHVEHGEAEQPQHEEDDGDAPQETQGVSSNGSPEVGAKLAR